MTTSAAKNTGQPDVATQVFELVAQVPKGKVTTYGELAKAVGIHPRQVGQILHHNEAPEKYPCHRVIKSDGSIASGYAFGGPGKQQEILEKEGVVFKKSGKKSGVDLKLFGW